MEIQKDVPHLPQGVQPAWLRPRKNLVIISDFPQKVILPLFPQTLTEVWTWSILTFERSHLAFIIKAMICCQIGASQAGKMSHHCAIHRRDVKLGSHLFVLVGGC